MSLVAHVFFFLHGNTDILLNILFTHNFLSFDLAFDGFNGTIFAYGQTGSGKTWSMSGTFFD